MGRPEGKGPLGRFRPIWVNIKIDLEVVGWNDMDWIGLVNAAMNLRFSLNAGDFLTQLRN